MTKPRLYLETTIPSYLTAWPNSDLVVVAQQKITKDWWRDRREHFDIYISEFVWEEAADGDPEAAKERLEVLKPFQWLEASEQVIQLGSLFIAPGILPEKAATDAAHIAVCAVHKIDYLMTWNCRHIANGEIVKQVRRVCEQHGFQCPTICTPLELMGVDYVP